jgi:hypothetical protein
MIKVKGGRILNKTGSLQGNYSRKTEINYRLISQTYRLINAPFLIGFKLPTLGKTDKILININN